MFRVSEVKSYPAGVATKIGQEIVGVMMIWINGRRAL